MPEQIRKKVPEVKVPESQNDSFVEEQAKSKTDSRKAMLEDADKLLDEIDEILDTDIQEEIDDIILKEEYKKKLKSIAFIGRRAADPCMDPNLIKVPVPFAEVLLSAGLATEHDCTDCD